MKPDFSKHKDSLVPVIIQDAFSNKVLMLGYMNEDAFEKTKATNKVTFFSRSKQRLWMKGETSGNVLDVKQILIDCDNDCLLIKATPTGPVCHTGSDTCFNEPNTDFSLEKLEDIIDQRINNPSSTSYVASLMQKGTNKVAQKVGEEAVELILESKDNNADLFLNEAADLLFHYLILLKHKQHSIKEVLEILAQRHSAKKEGL